MAAAIAIAIDEKWEAIEDHAQDAAYGRAVPVDYHVLPAAFPDHVATMMAREGGGWSWNQDQPLPIRLGAGAHW